MKIILPLLVGLVYSKQCYWNTQCPYGFYGTKTPYDTVRGDIRDHAFPDGCEAISVWRINRHGNRHPGTPIIADMKRVIGLKDEIIASYEAGTSQLCAQDIENFKTWTWKKEVDDGHSYLTKTGYEELYHIGKRFGEKYSYLLQGNADQFYFRPTNEQRTIASCAAFVHGMTDRVPLNVTVVDPWSKDEVIRPYETCDRYQKEVKQNPTIAAQEDMYLKSSEFVAVQKAVQKRLGLSAEISANNVLAMHQICRYFRTWTNDHRSPWCGVFSNEDLVVMEYYDDVSHFYKKGYGSWVNVHLGEAPLKDLYQHFEAVVAGEGRKLVSYYSHDTMLEMMYSALGLYFDGVPIESTSRNPNRNWRTSIFGAFSSNFMAILNRCQLGRQLVNRVQIFINELTTPICPLEGCTWVEFQEKFKIYSSSNLSFCDMDEHKRFRKQKKRY